MSNWKGWGLRLIFQVDIFWFCFHCVSDGLREFSPVKEKDKTIKAKIEFKTLPDIRQHRAYLLSQNAHQKGWPTKYAHFFVSFQTLGSRLSSTRRPTSYWNRAEPMGERDAMCGVCALANIASGPWILFLSPLHSIRLNIKVSPYFFLLLLLLLPGYNIIYLNGWEIWRKTDLSGIKYRVITYGVIYTVYLFFFSTLSKQQQQKPTHKMCSIQCN